MATIEELKKQLAEQEARVKGLKTKVKEEQVQRETKLLKSAEKKKLSDAELAEIRAVFDEFDADKSNFIELDELRKCVAKLGCKMSDAELDESIKIMDTNEDGKVSFDEFVEWYTSDKKLGGNAGMQLGVMKAKMRSLQMKEAVKRQLKRVKAAEKLKKEQGAVSTVNVSATMDGATSGKTMAAISLVPSTKQVYKSILDQGISGGLDKDSYRSEEDGINRIRIEVDDSVTAEAVRDLVPKYVFEDFGFVVERDPNTGVNVLCVYIEGESVTDQLMNDLFKPDGDDEDNAAKPADYVEPAAASVTLNNSAEDILANRDSFYAHNIVDGLTFTGKASANYKGIEALIAMLCDPEKDDYSIERRRKKMLPRLLAASGVKNSDNSLSLKQPDVAIAQMALEMTRVARNWAHKQIEEIPITEREAVAEIKTFIDSDEFILWVKKRMLISLSDYPLGFLIDMKFYEMWDDDKKLVEALRYIKAHFKRVLTASHFGKVAVVQAVFENLNPFILIPEDPVKPSIKKFTEPKGPNGIEDFFNNFDLFDDLGINETFDDEDED